MYGSNEGACMYAVNWTDTGKGAPMRTRVIGRRTTRKRGEL